MRASFFIAASAAFVVTLAALAPFILAAAGLLPTKLAAARSPRFITDTFEFVLTPGWSCDLEDTEHVCTKGKPPNDAIAIIALKRRGPRERINAYENHLRDPSWGRPNSKSSVSSAGRSPGPNGSKRSASRPKSKTTQPSISQPPRLRSGCLRRFRFTGTTSRLCARTWTA